MSGRNRIPRNPNSRGKTMQRNSQRSAPVLRGLSANQPRSSIPIPLCLLYSLIPCISHLALIQNVQKPTSFETRKEKQASFDLSWYRNLDSIIKNWLLFDQKVDWVYSYFYVFSQHIFNKYLRMLTLFSLFNAPIMSNVFGNTTKQMKWKRMYSPLLLIM